MSKKTQASDNQAATPDAKLVESCISGTGMVVYNHSVTFDEDSLLVPGTVYFVKPWLRFTSDGGREWGPCGVRISAKEFCDHYLSEGYLDVVKHEMLYGDSLELD